MHAYMFDIFLFLVPVDVVFAMAKIGTLGIVVHTRGCTLSCGDYVLDDSAHQSKICETHLIVGHEHMLSVV